MKRYVLSLIVACVAAVADAGFTTHLKLDCRTGTRSVSPDGETLRYDAGWYENGDEARIKDNGAIIATGRSGAYVWRPESSCSSPRMLTLEVLSNWQVIATETAKFDVPVEHAIIVSKSAVEPTSSMSGWTAEIVCSKCGAVIQAATEIPALGYVRNVTARQLWPHKKVEVCYDLAEDIGDVADEGTALELTGKYGSTTKTATTVVGDVACVAGRHRIVWDFESQGVALNQSAMTFTVGYGSVSGSSDAIAVNTSSSVRDGMSVGSMMRLDYSPIDAAEAVVEIDGAEVLSATNGGVFVWQPLTKGEHTIRHSAGENVWTRTVNVTSLVYEEPVAESTTPDENVTVQKTAVSVAAKGQTVSIGTGGTGTREVSTAEDWITIPFAYVSRNAGIPAMFSVAENKGVEARTGFVYVSGHVVTITQAGVGATLDGVSAEFEMDGGSGTFSVLAGLENTWRARANVDWISVETLVGTGECVIVYNVAPYNAVTTRSGTITAAGQTFTVNQTGRRLAVSPPTIACDWQSHDEPIAVDGLASTSWGVGVDATWLSIVSAGSGQSGGTVVIGVNPPFHIRPSLELFSLRKVA